jgi:dihydrofolate reductase
MTATYTFDVFSSLDGFGSAAAGSDWTGYWGKQGPELLDSEVHDPWVTRMVNLPAYVVSNTLEGPRDWPDATVVKGGAVDVVARLKEESDAPLRSHGSLAMNRSLMTAGLVDRVQVTVFPVITGRTGSSPIFKDAADFDLELIEARTLDGHTQQLIYRPTLH